MPGHLIYSRPCPAAGHPDTSVVKLMVRTSLHWHACRACDRYSVKVDLEFPKSCMISFSLV